MLRILLVLALLPVAGRAQSASTPAAPRKNVLLVVADDLNTSLRCYGNTVVQTPNLDRLAARGVVFERAYCQYPLCNPSRSSFLSGMRPETLGVRDNRTDVRAAGHAFIPMPEHFRRHGYFTARVGKLMHPPYESAIRWDLSEDQGADEDGAAADDDGDGAKNAEAKSPPPRTSGRRVPREKSGSVGGMRWVQREGDEALLRDGAIARRAVQILETKRDAPLFLAVGFHKPHLPWEAPKKYFEPYSIDKIALAAAREDDRLDIPSAALTSKFGGDEMTQAQARETIAGYYACVSFIDAQVGLLLDALERTGMSESTVVVFLSDHGFHLGEHAGLWAKQTLFEESARIPLLIAAPGKRAGAVARGIVEATDIFPTLIDLCGVPFLSSLEGRSLAPMLEDPSRRVRDHALTVIQSGKGQIGKSVRTERYRFTLWPDGSAELYDHDADRHEFVNLAQEQSHAQTVVELKKLLDAP
ncbi:MAG: sulfatase [Planctomycetota bacterium]